MAAPLPVPDDTIEALGLRVVDEIKSAIVRPGDTIIVSFAMRLNMQEYTELIGFCKKVIPDVNVLVLPEVADVRVFRPDGEGM